MLLTMQHEYERQSELFPNPERIEKVGCWGMCAGGGGSVFVKGFVFYVKFKLRALNRVILNYVSSIHVDNDNEIFVLELPNTK